MGALIPIALNIIGSIVGSIGQTSVTNTILSGLTGSNAGTVAEKVINAAKAIFGTDDPKLIELKIQEDKSRAELALAELNKDLDFYRLQVEDTKSARERDIEVRRISGTNARANVMLVMAFICLIVILVAVIFYRKDIPDGVLALMNMSAGALLAMLTQAFNFEFGSSRSSGEKTMDMGEALKKLAGG